MFPCGNWIVLPHSNSSGGDKFGEQEPIFRNIHLCQPLGNTCIDESQLIIEPRIAQDPM